MKCFAVAMCFLFVSLMSGQTTLYYATYTGAKDDYSYRIVDHATGQMVTHDKTTAFRNDTAFNFILIIDANKVKCSFKNHPPQTEDITGELGYLTVDKKIIELGDKKAQRQTRPSYIKENKIYDFDNKIVAYIEGDEMFGVALYLTTLGD